MMPGRRAIENIVARPPHKAGGRRGRPARENPDNWVMDVRLTGKEGDENREMLWYRRPRGAEQ